MKFAAEPAITVQVEYEFYDIDVCRPYYEFQCSVQRNDDAVFVDVQWYADGELVLEEVGVNAVAYADMPAVMSSDFLVAQGYLLGTNLRMHLML